MSTKKQIRRTQLLARVVLRREGKVLLQKRPRYKGGGFGLVGGHVEKNETPISAVIREAFEEVGVMLSPENLQFCRVIYSEKGQTRKVHFVFVAHKWTGTPVNREPKKCLGIKWAKVDMLPAKLSTVAQSVLRNGLYLSEPYQEVLPWEKR
ncbi:MAG: NUDIX domain-containing protein [Bacteroidota bacterium]